MMESVILRGALVFMMAALLAMAVGLASLWKGRWPEADIAERAMMVAIALALAGVLTLLGSALLFAPTP